MASTGSTLNPNYGPFYAGGNRTITASGSGNVIMPGLSEFTPRGATATTLTFNTPLPTDSLTASSDFFNAQAGRLAPR